MVNWKGLNKFKSDLKRHSRRLDKKTDDAIQDIGIMLNEEITTNAVFTGGRTGVYSTGNLRRLINYSKLGQAKASVVSSAHYSGYVEKGTRFMDAQPFFFNTIESQAATILDILERKLR
ncbi:HK97-gp10 family putative phage morphogenesis protein [Macrococcus sp. DPC7161]|uniref:HK97-gp10 family putative phage morphogenesis protein n=1 Tax=Macrococcus sp. DPC7161 TaxID=2507060 RepID=UPI0013E9896E|nr:HK97-gp10 family putative phage morphogenesis protein [Macrococcus sp. DPC7161]